MASEIYCPDGISEEYKRFFERHSDEESFLNCIKDWRSIPEFHDLSFETGWYPPHAKLFIKELTDKVPNWVLCRETIREVTETHRHDFVNCVSGCWLLEDEKFKILCGESYHFVRYILVEEDGKEVVKASYYRNTKDLVRDVRTRSTPERFFIREVGLSEKEARNIGANMKLKMQPPPCTLHFAYTIEDIERVYKNGPNSCMSGDKNFYDGIETFISSKYNPQATAPVACYHSFDLAVAYIKDYQDRIVGRAVVNTNDKTYARGYGNTRALIQSLNAAGYEHNRNAIEGCHILNIHLDGAEEYMLQPYLDKATEENGDFRNADSLAALSGVEYYNVLITEDGRMQLASKDDANAIQLPFRTIVYGPETEDPFVYGNYSTGLVGDLTLDTYRRYINGDDEDEESETEF